MKHIYLTAILGLTVIGGTSLVRAADDEAQVHENDGQGEAHSKGNPHANGEAKFKDGHGNGAEGAMAHANPKKGGNFVPPGLAKKPGGLPPGIAMNVAKGKAVPPGIAKKIGGGAAKGFSGKAHGHDQKPDGPEGE